MIVYKAINIKNLKCYIGKVKKDPDKYFNWHFKNLSIKNNNITEGSYIK